MNTSLSNFVATIIVAIGIAALLLTLFFEELKTNNLYIIGIAVMFTGLVMLFFVTLVMRDQHKVSLEQALENLQEKNKELLSQVTSQLAEQSNALTTSQNKLLKDIEAKVNAQIKAGYTDILEKNSEQLLNSLTDLKENHLQPLNVEVTRLKNRLRSRQVAKAARSKEQKQKEE